MLFRVTLRAMESLTSFASWSCASGVQHDKLEIGVGCHLLLAHAACVRLAFEASTSTALSCVVSQGSPRHSSRRAPRTVITTLEPRRADLLNVRVLPPRDFGAVARGAETLTYRVRWRRANGGVWCSAQAYETGAPLDAVPLETLKHGVPIRVQVAPLEAAEDHAAPLSPSHSV